jgi:hypothetical protein
MCAITFFNQSRFGAILDRWPHWILWGMVAVFLSACGGGGGGSSSGVAITVVPALGGFSAGAVVQAIKPNGDLIVQTTTTADGSASLAMGSYNGPFILKVVGAAGVTYYDEKTESDQPFSSADVLLSVVPASTITNGTSYGVTALTNLAAAIAGLNATSPQITGTDQQVIDEINSAVTRVQRILGLASTDLDLLSAPTPVRSRTDRLSAGSKAGLYGLLLAELATNSSDNALDQAKRYFSAGRLAKTNNFSTSSLSTLDGQLAALKSARTTLAAGSSSFIRSGETVSVTFSSDVNNLAAIFSSSSSSGGSGGATGSTITVIPGLGQFGAGARVELLVAEDGRSLLAPETTNASGVATFNISGLSSVVPFIIRVTGASTGVDYFDEGLGATVSFGADNVLLSIVPAKSLTAGASFGVTPVTHMAAAFAGLAASASAELRITAGQGEDIETLMYTALARARWALGYKPQKNISNIYRLNPLVAPDLAGSATDKVDLATAGGLNGFLLAELARSTRSKSSRSAYEFARLLGTAALDLKSNNFSTARVAAFQSSQLLVEIKDATSRMAEGLNLGSANNVTICIEAVDKTELKTYLEAANSAVKINPTESELAEMAANLRQAVNAQVRGTSFPLAKPTTCP